MNAWSEVIEAFGEEVVTDTDGSWSVSVEYDMRDVEALLRGAPCAFTTDEFAQEELQDQFGQGVDIELECGRLVSHDGLAVVDYSDDWQAGVSATLTVFPNREALARALAGVSA